MKYMTYEELKSELSERSISQLPALLQHIVRLCGSKPVFKDREAMLRFVGRAYDSALVPESEPRDEGGVYEPIGVKFYSQSRHQEMMLVTEGPHTGWICYRHPDKQWVSLRKATEADHTELAEAKLREPPTALILAHNTLLQPHEDCDCLSCRPYTY